MAPSQCPGPPKAVAGRVLGICRSLVSAIMECGPAPSFDNGVRFAVEPGQNLVPCNSTFVGFRSRHDQRRLYFFHYVCLPFSKCCRSRKMLFCSEQFTEKSAAFEQFTEKMAAFLPYLRDLFLMNFQIFMDGKKGNPIANILPGI